MDFIERFVWTCHQSDYNINKYTTLRSLFPSFETVSLFHVQNKEAESTSNTVKTQRYILVVIEKETYNASGYINCLTKTCRD